MEFSKRSGNSVFLVACVTSAVMLAACLQDGSVVPEFSSDGLGRPLGTGATATAIIGKGGGTLALEGVRIDVPAGALAAATQLQIVSRPDAAPEPLDARTPVYEFLPRDVVFLQPVTIYFPSGVGDASVALYWNRLTEVRARALAKLIPEGAAPTEQELVVGPENERQTVAPEAVRYGAFPLRVDNGRASFSTRHLGSGFIAGHRVGTTLDLHATSRIGSADGTTPLLADVQLADANGAVAPFQWIWRVLDDGNATQPLSVDVFPVDRQGRTTLPLLARAQGARTLRAGTFARPAESPTCFELESCLDGTTLAALADLRLGFGRVNECTEQLHDCARPDECVDTAEGYSCTCAPGFVASARGCEDVNECQANVCGAGASCTNLPGSYRCGCQPGFASSAEGGACADVDECGAATNPCGGNAVCTNTVGGFSCQCAPGHAWDGTRCVARTCADGNGGCSAQATCADSSAGPVCACAAGYTGDGRTCVDVDECATDAGGCSVNAVCNNTPGSFTCSCREGWSGDGRTCADIDECSVNNGGCSDRATCRNTAGSRTCDCWLGYVGDGVTCTLWSPLG